MPYDSRMSDQIDSPPRFRFAGGCRFLQRTFDSSRTDSFVTRCRHIVRDGEDCVGPFIEEAETPCGLWEPIPQGAPPKAWELPL